MSLIHATAVIEGDVQIGEGTSIGALCYIRGPVVIGKNNKIGPHVIIGTDGEHRTKPSVGRIIIGDNNEIKELTVIQRGTGDRETTIGNGCFIMDHVHIAHDCVVEDDVTMAPNIVLAGHVRILAKANLGVASIFHQFTTIGSHAMIGMGSVVTKDVPPFVLVKGSPAKYGRLNAHAFKSLNISETDFHFTEGRYSSNHPYVAQCLERFTANVRREVLSLT